MQYTQDQIATVIAYNTQHNIFRISDSKRVLWDLRNDDVANLRQAGISISYAEDFAQLKKQVRQQLVADKQL
jgi:hypothetical protein